MTEPYEFKLPITFKVADGTTEFITSISLWDGAHPCDNEDIDETLDD